MTEEEREALIERLSEMEHLVCNDLGGWQGCYEVQVAGSGGLCDISCQDGFDGFYGPFTEEELNLFIEEQRRAREEEENEEEEYEEENEEEDDNEEGKECKDSEGVTSNEVIDNKPIEISIQNGSLDKTPESAVLETEPKDRKYWSFFNGEEYVKCNSYQIAVEEAFDILYSYDVTPWEDLDDATLLEAAEWALEEPPS